MADATTPVSNPNLTGPVTGPNLSPPVETEASPIASTSDMPNLPPSGRTVPAPTPQAQPPDHHGWFGRGVKSILGAMYGAPNVQYRVNDQGQTEAIATPTKPGDIFRHILAGAILGGAAGAGSPSLVQGGARGGEAVQERALTMDDRARAQAQQEYQNRLRAGEEQRAQKGFETEQDYRKALIAQTNATTMKENQLLQNSSYEYHQKVADAGKAITKVYDDAGISPVYKDVSESDMHNLIQKNNIVSLHWEPTGVKAVKRPDGTVGFEEVYSAYDSSAKVRLTPELVDMMKKAGVDKYSPNWASVLKPGYELTPAQFIALKDQFKQSFMEQQALQKGRLDVEKEKADINRTKAEASKYWSEVSDQKEAKTKAAATERAMANWNKETAGGLSSADAFAKLTPGDQTVISESMTGILRNLDTAVNDVSKRLDQTFDTSAKQALQSELNDLVGRRDSLVRMATGQFVKPAAAGAEAAAPPAAPRAISASDVIAGGLSESAAQANTVLRRAARAAVGLGPIDAIVSEINKRGTLDEKKQYINSLPLPNVVKQGIIASIIQKPAQTSPTPGQPKVGDIVVVKGQRVKVTAIGPDGQMQGVPVQ